MIWRDPERKVTGKEGKTQRRTHLAVNTYEAMFLLDSSKVALSWDNAVQQVHDILTKHTAEIVASRQWDERRLAYSVNGHKKGTYLLTYFRTDGDHIHEISADCRLSDLILRELILRVHPKLVDHLVAQAMASTPGAPEEESREGEYDDRPRRRRRDD
jgi:small subunit ribosomal protein S6